MSIIRRNNSVLFNYIFLSLIILGSFPVLSQDKTVPILGDDELMGGRTILIRQYPATSLWGYMNGGADLYLEYGFDMLQVQEISYGSDHFKIELFRMNDTESAFGKFSISTFRCSITQPVITNHYCETSHQIQFARANDYVSITNETGNEEGIQYNRLLASKILSKTGDKDYEIPALFQNELFQEFLFNLKVIKGKLGLENGFADWSGRFEGLEHFKILVLPMSTIKGDVCLAIIEFLNTDDRITFCTRNNLEVYDHRQAEINILETGREYCWAYGENGIIILKSDLLREATGIYFKAVKEFLSR